MALSGVEYPGAEGTLAPVTALFLGRGEADLESMEQSLVVGQGRVLAGPRCAQMPLLHREEPSLCWGSPMEGWGSFGGPVGGVAWNGRGYGHDLHWCCELGLCDQQDSMAA